MALKKDRLVFWLIVLAGVLLSAGRFIGPGINQEPAPLIINEFMAANTHGLTDEDGDYSDWIEIHNTGATPINLAGWALSDDPADPAKWRFPDMSLAGYSYLIVSASGKDRKPAGVDAPLHTNFKLQREGEFLALYNLLDDRLHIAATKTTPQFEDVSYGLQDPGAGYGYLATATPGQANQSDLLWAGVVAEVQASAGRGFYETAFTVELSSATPGATIRYTLDGSPPTETEGLVYNAPISIDQTTLLRAAAFKANFRAAPVTTYSYIFLDQVLAQPGQPPGFPKTWGVYRETYKTAVEGETVPTDYEMDPEIVNHPLYRQTIKDDLKSIPSISLVLDRADFDIYTRPRERGPEWERPVSVEFIDPAAPGQSFQINAGLRIQGDIGRQEYIPKHSFRLFFRTEYGPGMLNYPLFPDSPVESFDTLILRGGVQSSYVSVWTPRRRAATYTEDQWLRESQIEMSGLGSHGRFVHLYLNGLYWGLYNLVERPDEAFGESYFKVDKEDWYAFNHDGIVNGSQEDIQELFERFVYTDDPVAKYQGIKPHLDTANFADYLILNWYAGTGDWPENNWYAGMPGSDGKLRYFIWDGELTWRDGAKIHLGQPNLPGYLWPNTVNLFFEALIQNPDFKLELADRLYKHLFNDGALTDARAQARWQRLNQIINRAIVGETARWGDAQEEQPLTREDWLEAVDDILQRMEGNGARLIAQAREAGYYPELDPPVFNQQGGQVTPDFKLIMSLSPPDTASPSGQIYYTTTGSDPRAAGTGQISPDAVLYQAPLVFTTTTHVKARLFDGQSWSALNEATFSPVAQDYDLHISEIMYNPPGPDELEFIELKNSGQHPFDLAGMYFEGIRFHFPAHTPMLEPGETLILVHNPEAFAENYPQMSIFGRYDGQLSNQGELIALKDRWGNVIFSLTYDDENGWPLSPDGRGDSLILINPHENPNDPKNWRASATQGGSPGTVEFSE